MSRRAAIGLVFLAFAGAYAVTYSFRPSTDGDLNSLQTRSLARHGDVDLARYAKLPTGFVVHRDGHVYSVYGIGVSLPGVPVYAILTRAGAGEAVLQGSVTIPFAAAAAVAFLLLAMDLLPRRIAVGTTVVFAFGTTMWPIATTAYWQHAPALLFMLLGVRAFTARRPVAAGLALGAATLVRPSIAILAAAIALFCLAFERRALGPLIAGALPAAIVYGVSNRWIFGSFTTSSYSLAGVRFDGSLGDSTFSMLLGWWRGLLVYSPVLVIGFVGMVLALRQRDDRERRLCFLALGALGLILFYGTWFTWWGGYSQFGYRYLLDAAPLLCLLAGYALEQRAQLRPPALALGALSVMTMAFGARNQPFGWDQTRFARSFSASPIGQAWIDAIDHPLDALGNLAVVCAVTAVVWVVSARLSVSQHTVEPRLA